MSKTIKTKAVIFDRDGVIISTEGIMIDSFALTQLVTYYNA